MSKRSLPRSDIENCSLEYYNATAIDIHCVHDNLMILRVRPDQGIPSFQPGQFTILGLGTWECYITKTLAAPTYSDPFTLIKRAYSISCSILNSSGKLLRSTEAPYLEFYITRVTQTDLTRPALTPRLFELKQGARLYCSEEARGHYCLPDLPKSATVIFVATGTGEAPHNAMLAELLGTGHSGRIVSITCVRHKKDLGYVDVHRELEKQFSNYRYLYLTTREPENVDPIHVPYTGKRYLQDYFRSGDFERDAQVTLSPVDTHIFLCGSPAMIGSDARANIANHQSLGMVDLLEPRGFLLDRSGSSGNIHTERYW